jgi:hypothetical protein
MTHVHLDVYPGELTLRNYYFDEEMRERVEQEYADCIYSAFLHNDSIESLTLDGKLLEMEYRAIMNVIPSMRKLKSLVITRAYMDCPNDLRREVFESVKHQGSIETLGGFDDPRRPKINIEMALRKIGKQELLTSAPMPLWPLILEKLNEYEWPLNLHYLLLRERPDVLLLSNASGGAQSTKRKIESVE